MTDGFVSLMYTYAKDDVVSTKIANAKDVRLEARMKAFLPLLAVIAKIATPIAQIIQTRFAIIKLVQLRSRLSAASVQ